MPFKFRKLDLSGIILIIPDVYKDDRGYFLESYKASDFKKNGIDLNFIQDNHSRSNRGVLRGLHYQKPSKEQGKLVRVIKGKVWDVVVDIRKSSPTFLKWMGFELSDSNHHMLYVPPGFAHGFIALEDNTHFIYKCSNEYSPEHECGIIFNDKKIKIKWPDMQYNINEKDLELPSSNDAYFFE